MRPLFFVGLPLHSGDVAQFLVRPRLDELDVRERRFLVAASVRHQGQPSFNLETGREQREFDRWSERRDVLEAQSEEELRGVAAAQWEAYEGSGSVPQRAVDGLLRTLEAGGLVVLARDAATGEPAGGGLCTGPLEGATELTSIGVREAFRRRGIAEAMTRRLAGVMHARGNDGVFLMAAGEAEARIYERAGFEAASEMLHISLAAPKEAGG